MCITESAELERECISCGEKDGLIFCKDCYAARCDQCSSLWHKHPKRLSHNLQVFIFMALKHYK